jgi:flagellar motor switch protein FliM
MSLSDPTAIYAVSLGRFDGLAALELSPPVAFTMVDRMLGGNGMTQAPNRPLTEIEQNVLDSVVKLLLEGLTETWRAIGEVEFRIHTRDTRPQMVQITAANEIVILLSFDVKIGEARGMLNLCIPATAIESMEDKVAQGWQRNRRQPSETEIANLKINIGRLPLPVTTQIATRLAARDLLDMQPGDVLSLGYPAVRPVEVRIGRIPRFMGHLTSTVSGAGVLIADTGQTTRNLLTGGDPS